MGIVKIIIFMTVFRQKQPFIGYITKGKTENSPVEEKQQSSKCSTVESSRKHKLESIL